jgi:hypothetical protein
MPCTVCRSENLMKLNGEITLSFPRIEDAKVAPLYFAQELGICLECGFADLKLPAAQLQVLRKKKSASS